MQQVKAKRYGAKKQTLRPQQISKGKRIVGINGMSYNFDTILAVSLLRRTRDFAKSEIRFIKAKEDMNGCDMVLGYGGMYNADTLRFDYHQHDFKEVFSNKSKYPMSSAGMVFKRFGKEIVKSVLVSLSEKFDMNVSDELLNVAKDVIYQSLIEPVDAMTNGFSKFDETPLYLNPTDSFRLMSAQEMKNENFVEEVEETASTFISEMDAHVQSIECYQQTLYNAKKALTFNGEKRRILLVSGFIQVAYIQSIENKLGVLGNFLFYIREGKARVTIRTVTSPESVFVNRAAFPESWRGLENEELENAVGEEGVYFCHHSGFMLTCSTTQQAFRLCARVIKELGL
ncbi:hypothetical protein EIN_409350 [Entamoeba invadens IP1]|uniref:Uncharacterized protein n=1 Tax=Entamoeba invadens IP1 TaxID=370355 RepID=A0A0A1TWS2_ENTIV|nr:hypothetical protein EIN_409350 [Entamoeba invadens IP1]ELP85636.1 hypothetical protein EIN_409350 [Entamoeba invadens IP1]|eukprot:XP_004184982.1 hypothetical protein EIN_409350 [Entamoeba invadens IP1]